MCERKQELSIQQKLDNLIASTPTGSYRNKITILNLIIMCIEANDECLETLIDNAIVDSEQMLNRDRVKKSI